MKLLFPYLARWRSANRSRYHQLLTQLCLQGHQVYVLKAPPMALKDISATDLEGSMAPALPTGLTLIELYASPMLRTFWRMPIPKSKMVKKGLLCISSVDQVRRFVDDNQIDALLVYNLPQVSLLSKVNCHKHFDLADDLVAMMDQESGLVSRVGGTAAARYAQARMLTQADTVTVASSVLAEQIDRQVFMLPNGADLTELDQADGSEWRSRNLGPCVGFVGAFEYWVDFELILGLARRLPTVRFLLVGGGRRWMDVKQAVEKQGLQNVHLMGAVSYRQAMNYAAAMDVCLLPFTHDPVSDGSCPLKLFEYAALRKPIISTTTREVERIGKGWVEFADDVAGFAEAVEYFLSSPAVAARAGEAGRAIVEEYYNWPALARQFVEYLTLGTVPSLAEVARTPALGTFISNPGRLISDSDKLGLAPRHGLASD